MRRVLIFVSSSTRNPSYQDTAIGTIIKISPSLSYDVAVAATNYALLSVIIIKAAFFTKEKFFDAIRHVVEILLTSTSQF